MPDALARLYNRYDCRPPKHLLEAALTGKTQLELAIERLRGQARWNIAKARDWERAAGLAEANGHPLRARLQRGDARFHRAIARRQYRQAAKLEADERGEGPAHRSPRLREARLRPEAFGGRARFHLPQRQPGLRSRNGCSRLPKSYGGQVGGVGRRGCGGRVGGRREGGEGGRAA